MTKRFAEHKGLDLTLTNNEVLKSWEKNDVFHKSIDEREGCPQFVFYEGPPSANGHPGIHHVLARAIKKNINVFPVYTEPEYKDCISNYEDVSIEKSVLGQLELGGFNVVGSEEDADVVLVVNNFVDKQGELVMGWDTQLYNKIFVPPSKPYAVADVRYANGGDNGFVNQLFKSGINLPQFGYAAWNTSANTLGSLLAAVKVKYCAKKYNEKAFKKLQLIRYLDDWAYQANVRGQINEPCDIKELMKPFEEKVLKKVFAGQECPVYDINYIYPWNRKFEIEVKID